jgi:branched-chain amino acid aminotransferase
MLTVKWSRAKGWESPEIRPFENLQISPFNTTLHYGIECFEGMKAYRGSDDSLMLFRPDHNMFRLKRSASHVGLPDFDGGELLKCIESFVQVEREFVPRQFGYSLYLRPTFISMENEIGVKSASHALLFVVGSPVGPYFSGGFKPASLFCEEEAIRCAPGGSGEYKVGGNYGPTIPMLDRVAPYKCDQTLWTYAGRVCEAGASNIFFVEGEGAGARLLTPPLNTMILPGVTRHSIIQLC